MTENELRRHGIIIHKMSVRKHLRFLILISILFLIAVLTGSILLISDYPTSNKNLLNEKAQYTNIDSIQLKSMLAKKDFYFVNVHIPYEGEIEKTDAFIPYNEIDKNLGKLPDDKNAKIVLYCRSGTMSKEASEKLTDLGYRNVYNQTGGMIDWEKQGYRLLRNQKSL